MYNIKSNMLYMKKKTEKNVFLQLKEFKEFRP